ncbi:hypothetical protein ACIGDM_00960 [Rothia koreensis]|uniref:hypothetical protein n=1 Tax=Rothia koreensis TaxID=592378 RepID=UPI0037C7FBBD
MSIIPMKYEPTGDIVHRPEHFLELFPDQLTELPSRKATADNKDKTTDNKNKEAK